MGNQTLPSRQTLPGRTAPAQVDARQFRDTLGVFASGVTVVTTTGDTPDEAYGMTVSAFSSVSLDPALVLVCVSSAGRGSALLSRSGVFTVNVLAAGQAHLSGRFADPARPTGARAFEGVAARTGRTGCPVLLGSAAHLDCRVVDSHRAGDHTIVVGEVLELGTHPSAVPLLVSRGRYRTPGDEVSPTPLLRAG